jgi:hypothetical protein
MQEDRTKQDEPVSGNQAQGNIPREQLKPQEKTTLGGNFNSGVTSDNTAEKEEIEKKGGMANIDQSKVSSREQPDAER